METSTPVNSPKRKKHSLVQKFLPVDESLGDIETEIQTRRQEAINKSTEARRRLSAAPLLAGYTASQLTQHCKDVIKLSTENKINCKNAFNFWLIDVMAAMTKKKDSEINKNFQVASCTLDASVKIYGYRVDAIHTDVVKMAGGFLRKEVGGEGGEEQEQEGGEEKPKAERKKKKRKKLTVVAPESLNARSEAEVLLNVMPRQNFLSRKADGNDLLVKIPKYNDGGLMLLDSDYPCWPGDCSGAPKFDNRETFDSGGLHSLFKDICLSKEEKLCPAYSYFDIGKHCEGDSDSEDELQMSQSSGKFEFDASAGIDEVEEEFEETNQRNRINIPAGGFGSDEDIVVQPEKRKQDRSLAISELKARITVNPLEYSMFDEKMFRAWAGPAHWKVRPARKPLEEFTNNEEMSKPVASKRTRKGRLKNPAGLFDILEDVLLKNMAENEKTTLFKSTMLNWNPQNTTMPEDLKYTVKNLVSLYHIPSLGASLRSDDAGEISDPSEGEGGGAGEGEEVEVGEEMEYCSAPAVHEDEEELPMGGEGAGAGDEAWVSGNMVEAPDRVEKMPVSTFKRRKHVDIKHLKRGLWDVLSGSGEEEGRISGAVDFEELVKVCPSKVAKSSGTLLSPPLIFNALLHLTNEKCLVLTQDRADKLKFVISQ